MSGIGKYRFVLDNIEKFYQKYVEREIMGKWLDELSVNLFVRNNVFFAQICVLFRLKDTLFWLSGHE